MSSFEGRLVHELTMKVRLCNGYAYEYHQGRVCKDYNVVPSKTSIARLIDVYVLM